MADPSRTKGGATFSVQNPLSRRQTGHLEYDVRLEHIGRQRAESRSAISESKRSALGNLHVQKHFTSRMRSLLRCEFVLPIHYFQYTRGVVNNFSTICEFGVCNE